MALCPRILALDDLRSGRLAAPLGFTPDGSEYGLIEPKTVPPGAAPADGAEETAALRAKPTPEDSVARLAARG